MIDNESYTLNDENSCKIKLASGVANRGTSEWQSNNSSGEFKRINVNARSLASKFGNQEHLLIHCDPGVVELNWLRPELTGSELLPPSPKHKMIDNERTVRGGGVAIVVIVSTTKFECPIYQITKMSGGTYISVVLILFLELCTGPQIPLTLFLQALQDYLTNQIQVNSRVIIPGNFNLQVIN